MCGDFSRQERHYSGVRMQQGRVQLDADWNEQVDIGVHLDETARLDVIGPCGMPADNAGFGIEVTADGDLKVSPGRAYVGGVLCENESTPIPAVKLGADHVVLGDVVADGVELAVGDLVELSAPSPAGVERRIAVIDVAQRLVTFDRALSDDELQRLAGKGATVRRVVTYLTQPFAERRRATLPEEPGTYLAYLDVWKRDVTSLDDESIREVALGGADTATRLQTVWRVELERADGLEQPATRTGRLRARAHPGEGYTGEENRLYRVEIHAGGELGSAAFKWSRENGSVVALWVPDDGRLQITSAREPVDAGFSAGDWVELTDDTRDFAGESGPFARIEGITGRVIDLSSVEPVDLDGFAAYRKIRRWDDPAGTRTLEVAAANDGYLALENGVEIRFEPGRYAVGDYWLIPARTATRDVEWPGDSAGGPVSRPAESVVHHRCRLALLERTARWVVLEDCRPLFAPLARPPRR